MPVDSSPLSDSGKALTPPANFPLYRHRSGRWAKKIKGKFCYFGHWAERDKGKFVRDENGKLVPLPDGGWEAALKEYKESPAYPRPSHPASVDPNGLTVKELVNKFLTAKQDELGEGEIGQRMFGEYLSSCKRLADVWGKELLVDHLTADDFLTLRKALGHYGIHRLSNEVQKVKTIFKHAYEMNWIDRPPHYGPRFKKPSAKKVREQRNLSGERMFEADECRRLIEAASVPLKAMILLGLNCGFGNHDCATLPLKALDLDGGWINYPRPKTAVKRRCPLWPETVAAIQAALAERPKPKEDAAKSLVFVTSRGRPWLSGGIANPVSVVASKLLKQLGINGRKGLGFYTLRHVFETIGGDSRDQIAVNAIMGHSDGSMAAVYRERFDDARLRAVVDHVHAWLFAEGGAV